MSKMIQERKTGEELAGSKAEVYMSDFTKLTEREANPLPWVRMLREAPGNWRETKTKTEE